MNPRTTRFNGARRGAVVVTLLWALVALPATPAAATDPDPTGRQDWHGQAAIDHLGDRLAGVARRNGLSPARLRSLLRRDPTLWITDEDRLYFADTMSTTSAGSGATTDGDPPAPLSETFLLHSDPDADQRLYLDFRGGFVRAGSAGGIVSRSGNLPPFSCSDCTTEDERLTRIQHIWQRVAEDFAPFDVDVTTEPPVPFPCGFGCAARLMIGGTPGILGFGPNVAGVAPWAGPGNPTFGSLDPGAFTFSGLLGGDEVDVAETISHEAGHTFGLDHDGAALPNGTFSYYAGHGSGPTGWCPIMGDCFNDDRQLSQWSAGDFPTAANFQDDTDLIADVLELQPDEAGNTRAAATPLGGTAGTVDRSGLITTRSDRDVYAFRTAGGPAQLTITPAPRGPDLDARIELLDRAGNVLATGNDPDDLDGSVSASLAPGLHFLRIDGVGDTDPLPGYGDYASLGAYTLTGSYAPLAPICDGTTTKLWDGSASDGSWHTGANWTGQNGAPDGEVPGAGDHVCIPADTTVVFDSGTTHVETIGSAGTLDLTGGSLQVDGAGGQLSELATVHQTGGELGGAGDLAITDLTLQDTTVGAPTAGPTTTVTGTLTAQSIVVAGRTLVVGPAATAAASGAVALSDGARLEVADGGRLDLSATDPSLSCTGGASVLVEGTLRKVGAGTLASSCPVENHADAGQGVRAESGEIEFLAPVTTDDDGGEFTATAGTTIRFADASDLGLSRFVGTGDFQLVGGTMTLGSADGPGTIDHLTMTGGMLTGPSDLRVGDLTWTSGTISALTTGSEVRITRTLTAASMTVAKRTLVVGPGASAALDNGSISLSDGAALEVAPGGTLTLDADEQSVDGGASVRIDGTLRKLGDGDFEVGPPLEVGPSGSVEVSAGILRVPAGLANYDPGPRTLTGGRYVVNGTIEVPSLDVSTLAAEIVLDGVGSSITDGSGQSGVRNLSGITTDGILDLRGGQDLTTPGDLTIDGVVALGPGSQVSVDGSLTQTASGSYRTTVAPAPAGPGRLTATESASLAGALAIRTEPGFRPAGGTTFEVVSGIRTGTYSDVFGDDEGPPFYDVDYQAGAVVVGAVPGADLHLTLIDAPDPAAVGEPLVYTATVENRGPDATTGVTLIDELPTGVTAVAAPGCAIDGSTVTCTAASLAVDASVSFDIEVTPSAVTAALVNEASVSSASDDLVTGNNAASASTVVLAEPACTITGTEAADTLVGTPGRDVICGLGGNDLLDGRGGADVLRGGEGEDRVTYESRTVAVTADLDGGADDGEPGENDRIGTDVENLIGGAGADVLTGDDTENLLLGRVGDDTLDGAGGGDTLHGGDGNDVVDDGAGDDVVVAGAGDDDLTPGPGDDWLSGGSGVDEASYATRTAPLHLSINGEADDGAVDEHDDVRADVEGLTGGQGDDVIVGNGGANTLSGDLGNDRIDGGAGPDVIHGGAGTDTVTYAARTEPVVVAVVGLGVPSGEVGEGDLLFTSENGVGGSGGDTLFGSNGVNRLTGGPGDDALSGLSGRDVLDGGADDDVLDGGGAGDVIDGGTGTDTADYGTRTGRVFVSLDEDADDGEVGEHDNVTAEVENVVGGSGNDVLDGSAGANAISGGDGDDVLRGLAGPDVLDGGPGGDLMLGGADVDRVSYADRSAPVVTGIGGAADDGEAGEGDNVRPDVEDLLGGSGNDVLTGDIKRNSIDGGPGDDTVDGRLGKDALTGGPGTDTVTYAIRTSAVRVDLAATTGTNGESGEGDVLGSFERAIGGSGGDVLLGTDGDDVLEGRGGSDQLTGRSGQDHLLGTDGNDQMYGGLGDDRLEGGLGNDLLGGDNTTSSGGGALGADVLVGGGGTDTVDYAARAVPVTVTLDGLVGDGGLDEGDNVAIDVEDVLGGRNADLVVGSARANRLVGGTGPDRLRGLGGDDVLDAGDGQVDQELDCGVGTADHVLLDPGDPGPIGCELP